MKKAGIALTVILIIFFLITGYYLVFNSLQEPEYYAAPVDEHGSLSVQGAELVDQMGNAYQMRGVSTHGIAWYPQYINEETFRSLRDDWSVDCIRLSLYTESSGGYCSDGDQEDLKTKVFRGIDLASGLGMYVIVDWHVLTEEDPLVYQEEAVEFFSEVSEKYGDIPNIIYEICNEPNGGTEWEHVKEYAESVIPVIRENDPDSVIIAGTPEFCTDLYSALESPLAYDNVMYSMHYYVGSHGQDLREAAEDCRRRGLPIFITEFGVAREDGQKEIDQAECGVLTDLIDRNGWSCVAWNLSNKDETCALISSSCSKLSGWSGKELSGEGRWVRGWYRRSR